ncbi:alpha/beta hydrolase [Amycolatopsis rubida]|uniref:Alpha/beta hydrolase n=1 Tax=Amycolatopsis rubida TaxID=112413 RepID=A0ABX0C886_9PSEU|nr:MULTISPECIES: alpha/beta hydrolase [Amycolatopsis]MYW96189.1 alpha/beta fold hydrolase [Amycolatopsis rubida]NEC61180.1 alpha/beta hydrolase [Amycolatopsis rubida]OAP24295.1 N-formylmaleamate deformylase [Amycolatopsis sp. M39]
MTTGASPARRSVLQSALADLADVPATSRWVRSGGVRLHVLDYGGDGVPLVVVPGITSPAITMDFVARQLRPVVRPIVVDMRGRGLSDSAASYDLTDYVNDLVAVVEQLELQQPLALGHSMGARAVGLAAARRAGRLRGTVLVDPPMSGPERGPYPAPLDALLGQLDEAQRGTSAEQVARAWPSWPRREQELRARWLASCDARAVAETHRGFETDDFFAFWPSVPVPTVLIHGADSPMVTRAGAAEARAANRAARLVEVPAAGHMVFWDAPDAGVSAVREVLAEMVHPAGAVSTGVR